jgi:hypothetical protein
MMRIISVLQSKTKVKNLNKFFHEKMFIGSKTPLSLKYILESSLCVVSQKSIRSLI